MSTASAKEVKGAWIIHHGRKLVLDVNGSADFPAINEAAKATTLLTKLGQTAQATVSKTEARAIAIASGFDPRLELNGILSVLERKRLIEQSKDEIAILGVTTRGSLVHASDIYSEAEPNAYEDASITLAEMASEAPIKRSEAADRIADIHKLSRDQVADFFNRAEGIGFVDREGNEEDKLLFNGNLFRRESVLKTQRVLSSLNDNDRELVGHVSQLLAERGCLSVKSVEQILTKQLFEKLVAAAVYDLNEVTNEQGSHIFVTAPSAFHKFVDPLVDDCFDMAKSLVAALTYGMSSRASSQGRITSLPALVGKLIAGGEVGPTTSIGQDYRVLEVNGVVKLRPDARFPDRFFLRLLKREIGELALQVLTQGNAYEQSLAELPSAPMARYIGPEESRASVRKKQSPLSRRATRDVLEAVRGGRIV